MGSGIPAYPLTAALEGSSPEKVFEISKVLRFAAPRIKSHHFFSKGSCRLSDIIQ